MATKDGKKTGGRKKGVPNKKNKALIQAVESSGLTPVEYLLSVMRDDANETSVRVDAANKVAPYVHPKLAHNKNDNTNTIQLEDIGKEVDRALEDIFNAKG